jgi:cytochrome c-type biogenesis protein CcmF
VLIGTLYPIALEAVTGEKISVGPPFFNATFLPLMVPLLLILPIGQALAWKRGDLLGAAQRLAAAFALAVLGTVAVWAATIGGPVAAPLGIGLGLWLIFGAINEIAGRAWRRGAGPGTILARAFGLPRAAWGSALAHAGVGVTCIGIAATAWGTETIATVKRGEVVMAGPYRVELVEVGIRRGPDYTETFAGMRVTDTAGQLVGKLEPGKRTFAARSMPTSEAGLLTIGLGQVYVSVAELEPGGSVQLRLYWKPWVLFLWLGSVVMAIGGVLSLTDRRARIGAPVAARASGRQPVAAA